MNKDDTAPEWQAKLIIDDVKTLKVLAHPKRLDILRNLDKPRTVKEVAERMDEDQTKLYYHVRMMEKAALIVVTETNIVSGIIEKKFRAAAREMQVSADLIHNDSPEHLAILDITKSLFHVTQQNLLRSIKAGLLSKEKPSERDGSIFFNTHHRLTEPQVMEFKERLKTLLDDLTAWHEANSEQDATDHMLTMTFFPLVPPDDSD